MKINQNSRTFTRAPSLPPALTELSLLSRWIATSVDYKRGWNAAATGAGLTDRATSRSHEDNG